ncbi:MAG: 3-methyl-2-oxobutanoate hydroxymethyltransferase [Moorella sp. (in: firmicutes)]|jgi:3-methyl-2-oxobutanoate hydroxymethyltransferase|uniref:3-methyl-2-oxobutanoate hydroxymethyltransferase n=1 Tax=Moorella sp. E306M TaxID=2572683 RepID=UPI0010FFB2D7|nr:3-methyl-2-oxobutanoate hydroxymethyltransferase [Moorella sp. E306M]MDK2816536.1 3-methyl-2-oxobutanoate hydroxymethyltransferase [Moorella sp. (in: firmicutes)]MDK2895303.1 3-methyl-2-oxobutanoate hydroxymethyltransferase [Moorella sp. (in: firmicutes)]GEA18039.1 3-methyl-2-oxobutanoate hydroxymethyltransferase [Moorella sp. E306M]
MAARTKITLPQLQAMKERGEKITMVTAYDYPSALLADQAGMDMLLVGDSLGMVVLGYQSTVPVTMDEMVHHTRAVMRANPAALVVADLPFLSYQASVTDAVYNAGRLVKEGGADAVKLEGGRAMVPMVRAIVDAGIPVMGHLGLTPQSVVQLGGYRVQGREKDAADRIAADAEALVEAGVFSLVLECVPADLARRITAELPVPTIGIGAGPDCDGQVLVYHDLLGLFDRFQPKFVKRYVNLGEAIVKALADYREEVRQGKFPGEEHSFR